MGRGNKKYLQHAIAIKPLAAESLRQLYSFRNRVSVLFCEGSANSHVYDHTCSYIELTKNFFAPKVQAEWGQMPFFKFVLSVELL
jgi:hypothetical protein